MKNGIIIFNVILLVLIGILFYLHFSGSRRQPAAPAASNTAAPANAPAADFKIAYIEMDSLEASFAMFKDVKAELSRKEEALNSEKAKMERNYKERLEKYQAQAATMTQVQSESATKDMMQLQQQMQGRAQALDQQYQEFYMRRSKDVKSKIETFLKQYNAQKRYAYIFAYEPGLVLLPRLGLRYYRRCSARPERYLQKEVSCRCW
jgi:outer membrane protein